MRRTSADPLVVRRPSPVIAPSAAARTPVYVPSTDGGDGNESRRPRVRPLDDEMLPVLVRYPLVRPDVSRPWLFLATMNHARLDGYVPVLDALAPFGTPARTG